MRNFGIEMEMHNITAIEAQNAIRAAGVVANAESYNHNTSLNWKVVTDSSIRDDRGMPTMLACEVVSPILNGENGFEQVVKVCGALVAAGAKVNKSTGLHVHVDATGLSVENIKQIFARYEKFENDIDAVLPASRRANSNQFCQTLRGISSSIARSRSVEGIAEAIMTGLSDVGWGRNQQIRLAEAVTIAAKAEIRGIAEC